MSDTTAPIKAAAQHTAPSGVRASARDRIGTHEPLLVWPLVVAWLLIAVTIGSIAFAHTSAAERVGKLVAEIR